jgi:hypothetical protein
MAFLSWEESIALAEAHKDRYRALIDLAGTTREKWPSLASLQRP